MHCPKEMLIFIWILNFSILREQLFVFYIMVCLHWEWIQTSAVSRKLTPNSRALSTIALESWRKNRTFSHVENWKAYFFQALCQNWPITVYYLAKKDKSFQDVPKSFHLLQINNSTFLPLLHYSWHLILYFLKYVWVFFTHVFTESWSPSRIFGPALNE